MVRDMASLVSWLCMCTDGLSLGLGNAALVNILDYMYTRITPLLMS